MPTSFLPIFKRQLRAAIGTIIITMRKLISIFLACAFVLTVSAQDVITMRDGSAVKAKVLELLTNEVKYKRWDNQSGPTYTVANVKIEKILFADGNEQTFTHSEYNGSAKSTPQPADENLSVAETAKNASQQVIGMREKVLDKHVFFGGKFGVGANWNSSSKNEIFYPSWSYHIKANVEWYPNLYNGNGIGVLLGYAYYGCEAYGYYTNGTTTKAPCNLGYVSFTPYWSLREKPIYSKIGLEFNFLASYDKVWNKSGFNSATAGLYAEAGWAYKCLQLGIYFDWLFTKQAKDTEGNNQGVGVAIGLVF